MALADLDDNHASAAGNLGDLPHCLKVLRLRYTTSYRDWQVCIASDSLDELFKSRMKLIARARDTGDAHAIDEARGHRRDELNPLIGARGRKEVDQAEIFSQAGFAHGCGFLRRQVYHD